MKNLILACLALILLIGHTKAQDTTKRDSAFYAIQLFTVKDGIPQTKWIEVQAIRHFIPAIKRAGDLSFAGQKAVIDYYIDIKTKKRITAKIIQSIEL
jgi:hypothetical protein